jgi:uncharacterized membrane protein
VANPLTKVVGGFLGGLVAGIVGYAVDIMFGAMFEAFQVFNSLFLFYGIIFSVISFFVGLAEAYYAGFFFSIGVIAAGFLLSDSMTILSGLISIAGVAISVLLKRAR